MANLNYQAGSSITFAEFVGEIEAMLTTTGETLLSFTSVWALTAGDKTLYITGTDLNYVPIDGRIDAFEGTITGFQLQENGVILMDWNGLSIPAGNLQNAIGGEALGISSAIGQLLFSFFVSDTNVAGTSDAQVHLETDLIDGIAAFAGEDTITLLGGDDNYHAGAGSDTMYGGSGDDTLFGGSDSDSIFGGADNDTLSGGTGLNALFGGDGQDTALFAGSFDVDNVTFAADGSFTSVTSAGGVVDTLDSIEVLEFASGEVVSMNPPMDGINILTIVDDGAVSSGAINPDGSGKNYLTERVFDDGRELSVTYNMDAEWFVTQKAIEDANDAYFWDTRELNFDETGALTSSVTVRDDGIEAERTYFEGTVSTLTYTDTENAAVWESKTTLYDPFGGLAGEEIVYDSGYSVTKGYFLGTQFSLDLFDGGDAFNWTSKSFFYGADGTVEETVVEFDDGRVATTEYVEGFKFTTTTNDFEDAFEWDTLVTTYNAAGDVVSREKGYDGFIGDDGEIPIEEVFRVEAPDWELG